MSFLVLCNLAACVPPGETPPFEQQVPADEPPLTTTAPSGDAVQVPEALLPLRLAFDGSNGRVALLVYLNRNGGRFVPGGNDPASNESFILAAAHDVPPFGGSDSTWNDAVACVEAQFSGFNVQVVTVEPTSGDYVEVVVGGEPEDIGYEPTASGVAPVDASTCRVLRNSVAFVFSKKIGEARTRQLCESIAHEVGHTISLDHAYLCEDPMSYLFGCGNKTFQDADADCGEDAIRPCSCGRASQNSAEILHRKLDGEIPLAELAPTSLSVGQSSIRAGERLRVTYARANSASDDAEAFRDGYLLSDDRVISTDDDLLLASLRRSPMAAGATRGPYSTTVTIPEDVDAGVYWVAYFVDHQNDVEELDEGNNVRIVRLTVEPPCLANCDPPELVAAVLEVDQPTVTRGARISVRYSRENSGAGPSGAFKDGYYLSTNSYISNYDRRLASSSRRSLAGGSSAGPYRRSLLVPEDVTPGRYYLGYWVDHEDVVEEANESNNKRALAITVQ